MRGIQMLNAMNATKLSSFISGICVATLATFIEYKNYNFIWVFVLFFPLGIVYVIGFEVWREWAKGENIGSYPVRPITEKGWKIYNSIGLRMLIFFLGAVIAASLLTIFTELK